VTLRPAEPADGEAVAAIWQEGWRDGHLGHVPEELHAHRGPEHFSRRARELVDHTVVATDGPGAVVGFVVVIDDEVEQLYVHARARGSGVADALLGHAEREIAERFHTAWLAVAEGNARARRFYERRGWRNAGPMAYEAAAGGGTFTVPTLRYEADVRGPRP